MSDTKSFNPTDLRQFTGSEHWYRHGLVSSVLYTDGAQYVAEKAGAYWLLDEIALAQKFEKAVQGEEFQLWKLTVKDNAANAHLRRRRRPTGIHQGHSFHRLPRRRRDLLRLQQRHPPAERILTDEGPCDSAAPSPSTSALRRPAVGSGNCKP